jgi:hypothetical protein
MIDDTTSLILKRDLRMPMHPPATAPLAIATNSTNGIAIGEAREVYPTSTVAMKPDKSICPDTPMLNMPALNAVATAREAKIMGVSAARVFIKSVNIPLLAA